VTHTVRRATCCTESASSERCLERAIRFTENRYSLNPKRTFAKDHATYVRIRAGRRTGATPVRGKSLDACAADDRERLLAELEREKNIERQNQVSATLERWQRMPSQRLS